MPGSKETDDDPRPVSNNGNVVRNIPSGHNSMEEDQVEDKVFDLKDALSTDEKLEDSIEGLDSEECKDLMEDQWDIIKDLTEDPKDILFSNKSNGSEEHKMEDLVDDSIVITKKTEREGTAESSELETIVNQVEEENGGSKREENADVNTENESASVASSKRYSLRQSTLISSRSIPWCQRFPPQASKVSLRRSKRKASKGFKTKKTAQRSKGCVKKNFELPPQREESKEGENKSSTASVPQPKKNSNSKNPKNHAIKNKKNKKKTESIANQPRINETTSNDIKPDEYIIINHQKKFKQYLFMGYNYNTGFGEDTDTAGPSTSGETQQSQDAKQKNEKSNTNTSERSHDSTIPTEGNSQRNTLVDSDQKSNEELSDSSVGRQRKSKHSKPEVGSAASSSKTEVEYKNTRCYNVPIGEGKSGTKKKISRLVTPYQILKGKAAIKNEYNLNVLKGPPGPGKTYKKSSHDYKGKLVTPSQILKGKQRQEKKKSGGVKVDDEAAGEPSSSRFQFCDSDSSPSSPERAKQCGSTRERSKYRAHTHSTSHNLGIEADEDTEEEDVKPRRKKSRESGNRGKREKKEKKRKKRRERLPEVEERVSSSVDEKDLSED